MRQGVWNPHPALPATARPLPPHLPLPRWGFQSPNQLGKEMSVGLSKALRSVRHHKHYYRFCASSPPQSRVFFFCVCFLNLFMWLFRVLLAAHGLFLLLLLIVRGLPCSGACRILLPQPGIEPTSSTLQGRFLTTGPPGKSMGLTSYL